MELETITLRLPKHLIEWLSEVSRQTAMTPSQIVTRILSEYYEIWRLGYEKCLH